MADSFLTAVRKGLIATAVIMAVGTVGILGLGAIAVYGFHLGADEPIHAATDNAPAAQQQGDDSTPHYEIIKSNQTGFSKHWAYALIKGSPSDRALEALAIQLRDRYPDTRFNICNSSAKFQQMDAHMSDVEAPLDESWVDQHCFAMVNEFLGSGWQAVGSKADGREDGRVLATLN